MIKFPDGPFYSNFPAHLCHKLSPPHRPWFDHPNGTWPGLIITNGTWPVMIITNGTWPGLIITNGTWPVLIITNGTWPVLIITNGTWPVLIITKLHNRQFSPPSLYLLPLDPKFLLSTLFSNTLGVLSLQVTKLDTHTRGKISSFVYFTLYVLHIKGQEKFWKEC